MNRNIFNYKQFISESNNTFGDEMEHLYNTDEDAKIIINEYIEGSDPTLRIANIINLLDDKEKNNLRRSIDNYLQNGLTDETKISTSVFVENKNIFRYDEFFKK